MRIIFSITEALIIDKIAGHLGLGHPDPPDPIAHAPPLDPFGTT